MTHLTGNSLSRHDLVLCCPYAHWQQYCTKRTGRSPRPFTPLRPPFHSPRPGDHRAHTPPLRPRRRSAPRRAGHLAQRRAAHHGTRCHSRHRRAEHHEHRHHPGHRAEHSPGGPDRHHGTRGGHRGVPARTRVPRRIRDPDAGLRRDDHRDHGLHRAVRLHRAGPRDRAEGRCRAGHRNRRRVQGPHAALGKRERQEGRQEGGTRQAGHHRLGLHHLLPGEPGVHGVPAPGELPGGGHLRSGPLRGARTLGGPGAAHPAHRRRPAQQPRGRGAGRAQRGHLGDPGRRHQPRLRREPPAGGTHRPVPGSAEPRGGGRPRQDHRTRDRGLPARLLAVPAHVRDHPWCGAGALHHVHGQDPSRGRPGVRGLLQRAELLHHHGPAEEVQGWQLLHRRHLQRGPGV